MWPREHGSWAVLLIPILAGFAAAGGVTPAVAAAFLAAALGGFCLRTPLQALAGVNSDPRAPAWAVAFAAPAAAGLAVLLAQGRWGLLAFAPPLAAMLLLHLRAVRERRTMSLGHEALGVAVLCLGGPAAFYAAGGALGPAALRVWLLSSLFFLGPIFHVKTAALQHRTAAEPALLPRLVHMRLASALWHLFAFGAVAAAVVWGLAPGLLLVPFAGALIKVLLRVRSGPARVDFRRLGYLEVGYSALFAAAVLGSAF